MCKIIESKHVLPGWGCCSCHTYNGAQRKDCRYCNKAYDGPAYEITDTQVLGLPEGKEVDIVTAIQLK